MSSNNWMTRTPPTPGTYFVWLAVLAIIPAIIFFRSKPERRDGTIDVAKDDAEMTAAIARARAELPQFWQVFERRERGESDFALKVGITDGNGTEHFWANEIARTNGQTMGTINNDANIVKKVKLGDRIVIPEADISDWTYTRDGKMAGNYTLRVLFKKMSADEVERYKKMMADP